MAEHSLTKFKSKLTGGGARPNLFKVEFTNANGGQGGGLPSGITKLDTDKFEYLCKAANLPASNVASIDVPFRGRTFKVAGDRTFDTWTITIINDTDFKIRQTMEEWCQKVANYQEASGATNPADYMGNATVIQLGRKKSNIGNGSSNSEGEGLKGIAQYKFVDIFPINVSAIDLSYDTTDTIEEFTVEFSVNYWYPEGTPSK
mgnify:CR=1 FL=1|jgi:hypothetical protein|tara:strand:+ start:43 stop:651 length:609 start_codon:yes stop_codon:yes gene_type:complete